jgi:pimeloyl-ACP methyl ester carboxylesterase
MLLTHEQQIDTLHAAAREAGLPIEKDEIVWQDEFAELNGLQIHYIDWGTAGAPPLLLLHGGMQNSHSWDLTAVALKREFHVVAMDLRGHGDSAWSDEGKYSHADHADDIAALIERLGWERPIVMGLSLGGLSATRAAYEHPERVSRLVIIDVGPQLNTSGVGRIMDFSAGPAELDSIDDFIQRAVEYNPRRKPEQLRYSLTHNLRELPNGKYTWKYDRRIGQRREVSVGEERPPVQFEDMWERLADIRCPTLVVRGEKSDVFAEETGLRMADVIPDCNFVTVPNAGHTVPQDNASGFLEIVTPFLRDEA